MFTLVPALKMEELKQTVQTWQEDEASLYSVYDYDEVYTRKLCADDITEIFKDYLK